MKRVVPPNAYYGIDALPVIHQNGGLVDEQEQEDEGNSNEFRLRGKNRLFEGRVSLFFPALELKEGNQQEKD